MRTGNAPVKFATWTVAALPRPCTVLWSSPFDQSRGTVGSCLFFSTMHYRFASTFSMHARCPWSDDQWLGFCFSRMLRNPCCCDSDCQQSQRRMLWIEAADKKYRYLLLVLTSYHFSCHISAQGHVDKYVVLRSCDTSSHCCNRRMEHAQQAGHHKYMMKH